MFDERLKEFLGKDFELLKKPTIYYTKKEKFRILQAIVLMFGGESRGDLIILSFDKDDTERMDIVESSIESLLDVAVSTSYNKEEKHWEIIITDFKK
ncbi:MAG: hypothetical protein HeimC3_24870 [Candidatus Heimdallarchaeota archaeon LC_3]|nr:MAG: hypothetical protein HeimC3_24870 [Candidatus Heimdallarchaeota archaeon LC_3]